MPESPQVARICIGLLWYLGGSPKVEEELFGEAVGESLTIDKGVDLEVELKRPHVHVGGAHGGEPVVHLAKTDKPRKGGRNQQLVLAGLELLKDDGMDRIVLLSGGTDGEDGPTDAAGAWADAGLLETAQRAHVDPRPYLEINDSYTFFEQVGGLLKTGPTNTNVMDLRLLLIK